MMKKIILMVVIAIHTHSIMPMFNFMPRLNVYVCCFSLGCTIPEENECLSLDLCCAGIALGCPSQTNAGTSSEKNNNSQVALPKKNGDVIVHHGIDRSTAKDYTSVVCVQPDAPKDISLAQRVAAAQVKKTVDTKTHIMMGVKTINPSKSKKINYSYSYHSETIQTPNSYSKRTVERVSTPYENRERKSVVLHMVEPDDQIKLGVQQHRSASQGPIITEVD